MRATKAIASRWPLNLRARVLADVGRHLALHKLSAIGRPQYLMHSTLARTAMEAPNTTLSRDAGYPLGAFANGQSRSAEPAFLVDDLTRRNISMIADIERAAEAKRSMGEKFADGVAAVIGSWTFIIIQSVLLTIWVTLNLLAWAYRWDPYPFILLNLALSFQAAYASPIIMMSQNRQTQLADRRNHLDLQINLLAEQENTEMLRLLRRLCEAHEISVSDGSCDVLEKEVSAAAVLQEIDEAAKQHRSGNNAAK